MSAIEVVQDALINAGSHTRNGRDWNCPNASAHSNGDSKPSFHVEQSGSKVILNCMRCSHEEVMNSLGLQDSDLFDEELRRSEPEKIYNYVDQDGVLLYQKLRYPGKKFIQRKPNAGGWTYKLGDVQRVLYNLPEVANAKTNNEIVFIVEGERDADTLIGMGYVATTNYDGAGKWRADYNQFFQGLDVIVLADSDEPGRQHAELVEKNLTSVVKSIVVKISPFGKDITDHINLGHDLEDLVLLGQDLRTTEVIDNPMLTGDGFVNWEAAYAAAPTQVPWIVEPFLEEGMTHALWGIPGHGKSIFVLETVVNHVITKTPVLYVDSENNLLQVIIPRLKCFGMKPEDLVNLKMLSFADLEPLDTPAGGRQLLEKALLAKARLVVIDTTSRFVEGDENSADTFLRLYNNTLMLLKRENIASLRLDHPGKDVSRGTRGSSAKYGDIDYEWSIEDDVMQRILTCTKSRTGNVDKGKVIHLRKHGVTENNAEFYHEWDYSVTEPAVPDVVLLRNHGVAANMTASAVAAVLRAKGEGMSKTRICAALKLMRSGSEPSGTGSELHVA